MTTQLHTDEPARPDVPQDPGGAGRTTDPGATRPQPCTCNLGERIAEAIAETANEQEAAWDEMPDDERPGRLYRDWWSDGMDEAIEIARRIGDDHNANRGQR
jgi:hypothetical protein